MEYFLLFGLVITAFFVGYYTGAFWHTGDNPELRKKGASWWK